METGVPVDCLLRFISVRQIFWENLFCFCLHISRNIRKYIMTVETNILKYSMLD